MSYYTIECVMTLFTTMRTGFSFYLEVVERGFVADKTATRFANNFHLFTHYVYLFDEQYRDSESTITIFKKKFNEICLSLVND